MTDIDKESAANLPALLGEQSHARRARLMLEGVGERICIQMPDGVMPQAVVTGHCLSVLRRIPTATVDAVVTSPPYNRGVKYGVYNDARPREEFLLEMDEIAAEIARVLAPDGHVFLNVPARGADPLIGREISAQFLRYLRLQNEIVWVKSITVGERTHGQFRPINSPALLNRAHEQILHLTRSGRVPIDRLAIGVPYQDKSNIARWETGAGDLRCGSDVWFIPYETVQRRRAGEHPAAFPLDLPLRSLRLAGRPGVVLDPFLGSGTTLLAARSLGWAGIGIEIDPIYAAQACDRLWASRISADAA